MSGWNSLFVAWLSVSFWGGLLILALLLGKRFWKNRLSRQWQYYVWLLVILRLLLPFGPGPSLPQALYRPIGRLAAQVLPQAVTQRQTTPGLQGDQPAPAAPERGPLAPPKAEGPAPAIPAEGAALNGESTSAPQGSETKPAPQDSGTTGEARPAARTLGQAALLLAEYAQYAPLIWLAGALGLLLRRITAWQEFMRYLRAGAVPVDDIEVLERLSAAAGLAGVRRPVELWKAPMLSSPLLVGLFRPCILLPGAEIPGKDFGHIVLHELTHFRRGDIFYKWLVQLALCLHWFNPLVQIMGREIERACELSCDEAVLARLAGQGRSSAPDYGRTLLDAMASQSGVHHPGALHLSENKQLLQERLAAIMQFRAQPKPAKWLAAAVTLCLALLAASLGMPASAAGWPDAGLPGAAVSAPKESGAQAEAGGSDGKDAGDAAVPQGAKPSAASGQSNDPAPKAAISPTGEALARLEKYYAAGSLPLFELEFSGLAESEQQAWLERLYAGGDHAFFSAALRGLDPDSPLRATLAERAYQEEALAFFSAFADWMEKAELEAWLERALEDDSWAFQSVLSDRLGRGGKFDEKKEQWEKQAQAAQRAEYEAVGVTVDGKTYYYEGQRINIFLDIRADGAFYTLSMDPVGVVNLRILRDAEDAITGITVMSEAEAKDLLGELS